MNFAIIGTNYVSDWLITAGKNCEKFHVQAVYSRTMERAREFADKYGIEDCYDSLDELAAAANVDAVYVASPNALHAKQSIQMMNGGKHVLCEKSIASNERELQEMLKTAKKNHVIVMEAMRSVMDPGFAAIQEHLPKIGRVRRATIQYCQYSGRYDKFKNGIIENAFKPELSNGSLMDIGVYCVHPMVKLFGRPDQISASCVKLENGVDGMGTIMAKYEKKGILVELIYSKITDSILPTQIQGEAGSMIIEEIPNTNRIKIRYRDKSWEEICVEKVDPGNNMYYEIEEFIRIAERGESADEHNQYSIWEMQVMDEARRQMGIVFPADKV
ncbi:MAG: Gfo/Idh/MocA family oxidoreductase [Eubacteriales bacterium]|nr:Gfo/Idh/MocA family oxidoreductase [Eubacteriales bacterium]